MNKLIPTITLLVLSACADPHESDLTGPPSDHGPATTVFEPGHDCESGDSPPDFDDDPGAHIKFDLGEIPDAGALWCGDGLVDASEECDTALPLIEPCPNAVGVRSCQADCTWDTTWCWCAPGELGCTCNVGGCNGPWLVCSDLGVCEPAPVACVPLGDPCLAVDECCSGLCTEDLNNPNTYTCL